MNFRNLHDEKTIGLTSTDNLQHYRVIQCLEVADETEAVVSEYPFIYCNAYGDMQSRSFAVGICLPATCLQDRLQVGEV